MLTATIDVRIPLLTPAEEIDLGRLARAGDRSARDVLILRNAGLVRLMARWYRHCGIEHDDLIQVGQVGLIRAATSYDPDKHPGVRFSSFATWRIRGSMVDHVKACRHLIRVPAPVHDQLYRDRYGLAATESAPPVATIQAAGRVMEVRGLTGVYHGEGCARPFERPAAGQDSGRAAADAIEEDEACEQRSEFLAIVRRVLTAREFQAVALRCGLSGPACTLEEVGRAMGFSKQRARQITEKAIRRLRRVESIARLGGQS